MQLDPPPAARADAQSVDDPRTITRPHPALLRYYAVVSCFALIFFPLVFIPFWFRYRTLRYRFDEEGVSMSHGRFYQRETYLTYRRIQDIRLTRGFLQRRFGLGVLELQTASGASTSEMKIEGIRNPEGLRDFLYERMRGVRDAGEAEGGRGGSDLPSQGEARGEGEGSVAHTGPSDQEALRLLREIRDELRRVGGVG